MKPLNNTKIAMILAMAVGVGVLTAGSSAFAAGKSGTTLAAYKTIDICTINDNTWRYSGVISAWNEGAVDTLGLVITDVIQSKLFSSSGQFVDTYPVTNFDPVLLVIPAGTTQLTALTTKYSADAAPLLDSYIRNSVQLTITNHSGSLGTPKGPNPKATYTGTLPPLPCEVDKGCTYTQGYWGNKPGVVWPSPYDRNATFFLATKNGACIANCAPPPGDNVYQQLPKTWQEVLDTNVSVSQGYYQLAHQYIAAVLNIAKTVDPAVPPTGVQDTLALALAWLTVNAPSACTAGGSCGIQKDWAATLDLFNKGEYPEGPPHCTDE